MTFATFPPFHTWISLLPTTYQVGTIVLSVSHMRKLYLEMLRTFQKIRKRRDPSSNPGLTDAQTCDNHRSVCWGCHNRLPQTGQLTTKTFIPLQFWGPEVQNQGVCRQTVSEVLQRKAFPVSSDGSRHASAYGHLTLVSASIFTRTSSLGVFVSSLFEDASHWIYDPPR